MTSIDGLLLTPLPYHHRDPQKYSHYKLYDRKVVVDQPILTRQVKTAAKVQLQGGGGRRLCPHISLIIALLRLFVNCNLMAMSTEESQSRHT